VFFIKSLAPPVVALLSVRNNGHLKRDIWLQKTIILPEIFQDRNLSGQFTDANYSLEKIYATIFFEFTT